MKDPPREVNKNLGTRIYIVFIIYALINVASLAFIGR